MVQTVTSHDYPDLGTFDAHSVLTCRLRTMGRVVQCSKGFLPQVKKHNHWINVSKSLETFEAARAFLFEVHHKEAQALRGWSDEELQQAVSKAQAKDLKLWSDRLQKRIALQKQLDANLPQVQVEVIALMNDPATQTLSAKNLGRCLRPLCEAVFFSNCETSRIGQFRAMEGLLCYCDDVDRQKQVLDRLAEVD